MKRYFDDDISLAAGLEAVRMVAALREHARYAVPPNVEQEILELAARYGRVVITPFWPNGAWRNRILPADGPGQCTQLPDRPTNRTSPLALAEPPDDSAEGRGPGAEQLPQIRAFRRASSEQISSPAAWNAARRKARDVD